MTSTIGISVPLCERLGLVVIQWSHIEGFLAEIVSRLLMADAGSMYAVTSGIPSSTQIKWVRTLVTLRFVDGETKTNILDLLKDLDELRTDRNVLVHGLWGPGPQPDTAVVQTTNLDRAEMIKSELVSLAELDELVAETATAVGRCSLLLKALGDIKLVSVEG